MTPEIFHRNRLVMAQYKLNDNVVVKQGTDAQLGTIVDYDTWNADRKVYLVIKMHTEGRLRREDAVPHWTIDPDLTYVKHV
jgi:hypothetical protein